MKRIHGPLLFALFSAGFAGCNLDRFPEMAMAEKDFWNPRSEDEFKYAVNHLRAAGIAGAIRALMICSATIRRHQCRNLQGAGQER